MADADIAVVEQPQPVTTPEPAAPTEPVTIAEHEKRYGPNGVGELGHDDDDALLKALASEETPQERRRGSRSKSHQAAAVIDKLNGKIFDMRQELETLKAKSTPAAQAPSTPQHVYRVPPVPTGEFAEPEPQLEQFADQDDPYGAWQRALARYDRRKEDAEAVRQHQTQHVERLSREQQQYWQGVTLQHQSRFVAALAANPQPAEVIENARQQLNLSPLLNDTILLDNDGGTVALFLATHPDVLDELVLKTAAQPVTEQTVAITRRLLRKVMSAETTGSVPSPVVIPTAPRPPNPVRTGTIRTTETPPDDTSMSLAAHERFYGKGKRR